MIYKLKLETPETVSADEKLHNAYAKDIEIEQLKDDIVSISFNNGMNLMFGYLNKNQLYDLIGSLITIQQKIKSNG